MAPPGPPPRPNIGSMLLMTAFFFFMSGGNNTAVSPIVVGPDGEIVERVTELGMAGKYVQEYKGFLNGTGNWTEVSGISGTMSYMTWSAQAGVASPP